MRSGVEIWVEYDKAEKLQTVLNGIKTSTFVHFNDETINSADIVGIFKAWTMIEYTKRKNGNWKCDQGNWHEKGEKCNCVDKVTKNRIADREERIKNCGKCSGGFKTAFDSSGYTVMIVCGCIAV